MKRFVRAVLVLSAAGLACSAQGGTITSGSFHVGLPTAVSANVSDENFTAQVTDTDAGPFIFSNFPPFQPFPAQFYALTWVGVGFGSGVLYNGVFYPVFDGGCCPQGPIAGVTFTENPISPLPIVTGPGTYLDLFSVTLSFTLRDSSGTILHSETDTGFATGSITYTPGDIPGFLHADGFSAIIIPEPSSWSFITFGACFLGAFAGIRLRRQLPVRPTCPARPTRVRS
ncbi:MAG TPA: hypothetical protein VGQ49_10850 [Bryobacteraceae bacterium]|jgi:hypothetical protein|nr:hypothetical protein [Bryobacteraceae bacterium]